MSLKSHKLRNNLVERWRKIIINYYHQRFQFMVAESFSLILHIFAPQVIKKQKMEFHNERRLWSSNLLIKLMPSVSLPCEYIWVVSSREGFLELFKLKTCECCSVSSLFPFLGVLVVQVHIAMLWHWTVSTQLRNSRSVVVRRATVVRYVLQLGFLRYAHTGLMERMQSIDVENFLGVDCKIT